MYPSVREHTSPACSWGALTPVPAEPDEPEEFERNFFSFDEVLRMVRDGRIVDSMTIIAVLRVVPGR